MVTPKINDYLETLGTKPLKDGVSLYDLLRRPEIKVEDLTKFLDNEYEKDFQYQYVMVADQLLFTGRNNGRGYI